MIFTGLPRSGTMTIARMFGVHHERQFTSDTRQPPDIVESESSWFAAEYVQELRRMRVPIIHVVRNPASVLASLLARNFFDPNRTRELSKNWEWVRNILSLDGVSADVQPAAFMLRWTMKVIGCPRIRIEDIALAPRFNSSGRGRINITPYTDNGAWRELQKIYAAFGYESQSL